MKSVSLLVSALKAEFEKVLSDLDLLLLPSLTPLKVATYTTEVLSRREFKVLKRELKGFTVTDKRNIGCKYEILDVTRDETLVVKEKEENPTTEGQFLEITFMNKPVTK